MMVNKYPHCKECLEEVGVIELVGFFNYPDANGYVPHDQARECMLDYSEGYICGHCGGQLDFTEGEDATRIEGVRE